MKISRNYHSILVSQMVFPVPSSHIDNSGHDKHCQMNNDEHEKQTEEKMKTFKLHYDFRKKSVISEPTFPKFNTFFFYISQFGSSTDKLPAARHRTELNSKNSTEKFPRHADQKNACEKSTQSMSTDCAVCHNLHVLLRIFPRGPTNR